MRPTLSCRPRSTEVNTTPVFWFARIDVAGKQPGVHASFHDLVFTETFRSK